MKPCKYCNTEKPLSEFYMARKNYYINKCNTCRKQWNKVYFQENKLKCKISCKNWRDRHPENVKKTVKKYMSKNKENISNVYIKYILMIGTSKTIKLKAKDISNELIEIKRKQLKLKKLCKQQKQMV